MFSWLNFNPRHDLVSLESQEANELISFISQYHDIPCAVSERSRSQSQPFILPSQTVQHFMRSEDRYHRPSVLYSSSSHFVKNVKGHSVLYKNIKNELKKHTNCPVCSDEFAQETEIFVTVCLHVFCNECMYKWSHESNKKTCPMCRAKL